jgi:hypothetical protein
MRTLAQQLETFKPFYGRLAPPKPHLASAIVQIHH